MINNIDIKDLKFCGTWNIGQKMSAMNIAVFPFYNRKIFLFSET